ncbi:outer membrane receptor protein involved in Fe transport [Povalibacter uvarum]|uniref:Outer membrane receptor protein involved in Fe transport n=1 Tax=Povalibacter uvarum TaxID=732238 RepID=A0A841HUP2_9GAMM|nr:TonB-dependent receptor [Povalibacter uvarum]MBB6096533.1 outer membrane receptor protein involved in Fe transport [Povalibacter uvarum]
MSTSKSVQRAVRLALLTGAVATVVTAVPAVAQEQSISEVVVTGTRIANRDASAETPIFTVSSDAIVESGLATVDHYLNTLPQVTPNLSSQSNNPSSNGRAFIDLRGLGTNRNLVLINGKRAMGSTGGGVVDVNTIPTALIDRVEVITGGAAATYGPDAVAGVVNFIMKKSFDGVALNTNYNLTEEGDGQEWGADMTFGGEFADGKGNAIFNAGYFKRDDMYKDAREFSAQASTTTSTYPGGGWAPGAAANQPTQAAVDTLFGPGRCDRSGGTGGFGFNPDGSVFCTGIQNNPTFDAVGFTGPDSYIATAFYPDFYSYNFEPDNILVLPMERWNLFTSIDLEVSEWFRPYAQAQYTNYNALQELAPTPAAGSTGFTVPVTNPFIPTSLAYLAANRANPTAPLSFSKRFNDLGGRTGYNTHDVWQLTIGGTGDITETWTYDVYASYGRSVQNEVQGGNVRRDRVQALLNAADGGASLCAGGLNLFGSAAISQACKDYISLEAKNLTVVEQNVVEGVLSGEVFSLPAGAVMVAVGAGYRDLSFDFRPDGGLQPGLVAGFNQQLPVNGKLNFTDLFGEVNIPILADLPGVKSLGVTAGVRTTDNNIFGDDETWKLSLDWSIVDWARFRAGVQKAVRSPSITELFSPQVNNFPTFTNQDPCNVSGAIAAQYRNGPDGAQVRALCTAQSATAGGATYVQPSGQATGITGGNPNLSPETADSFTVGFVLQSPFDSPALDRLSMSVDYWSIELEDVIGAIEASTIVQRCFNREGANPNYDINNAWCQMFSREQSNGGVINLQQLQVNQAFFNTSGIDLTFGYGFDMGDVGDLSFQLVGTWIEKFEEQTAVTPFDPVYDYGGTIGSTTGTSYPEWKGTLVTAYTLNDFRTQLQARYIDAMDHRNTVTGGSPVANTSVPATWYLDMTASYDVLDNVTIRLGVNNLTNQEPRLYTPNVQANTDPSLYDVLGRRYFLGFEMRM